MTYRSATRVIALAAVVLFPTAVFADTEGAPRSWQTKTIDGEHVFVMLAPDWLRAEEVAGNESSEVPPEYTVSGLYRMRDLSEPVYALDWYAHRVDLSFDGRYAVRHGPWASSTDDLAVAFYDNGHLLHAYEVGDLILMSNPWDYTTSHFFWINDWEFDSDKQELYVSTRVLTRFIFDITTGETKSSLRGDYIILACFAVCITLLIYRRRCKKRCAT